jgi:hypothetical protein
MTEQTAEIKKTLRDIFTYIGGIDLEYVNNATVQSYIERLIKRQADAGTQAEFRYDNSPSCGVFDNCETCDGPVAKCSAV